MRRRMRGGTPTPFGSRVAGRRPGTSTSGGSDVHDLVIRNGTVVDGRGGTPVLADVAVDDGRITAVGTVDAPGREELDATGLAVTPGFVDVHTHYDGQVTWDPMLTPSLWHGVTTVVMGNCGVGFAPAAPDRRDWLIGLMEGVEGIPGASLREAIRWDWQSVPEYMDALDRIPRALDVAVQVPHGAVRALVMGERGAANEAATDDDIAAHGRPRRRGRRRRRRRCERQPARAAQGGRRTRGPGHLRHRRRAHRADPRRGQGFGRRGATARSCPAPPAPTAPCGTARSTCSRPHHARRGVAITFAFGGSSRQRLARPARAHGARERRRRAHRPADQLARAGPVLRPADVAPVPRPPHVRRDRAPARRRARRPHGRARRARRHPRRASRSPACRACAT